MTQRALPLVANATRCGYCNRLLVLQDAGDWACARCKPLLAKVTDVESFRRFQLAAARSKAR